MPILWHTIDSIQPADLRPMHASAKYRVIDRKKFAVAMVVLLSAASVGTWVSLDRTADFAARLAEVVRADPIQGARTVTQVMRFVAILNGIVLSSFAALIIRQGWKGWLTASMPPAGSWVLEGQRTWAGEPAKRIAKFTVVIGALLLILALATSWTLWGMSDTLIDQIFKQSRAPNG